MAQIIVTGASGGSSSCVGSATLRMQLGSGISAASASGDLASIVVRYRVSGSSLGVSTIANLALRKIVRSSAKSAGKAAISNVNAKKYTLIRGTSAGVASADSYVANQDFFSSMWSKVPGVFRDDWIMRELMKMFAVEATILAATVQWVLDQKNVDTASEVGLQAFESELKITAPANATLDERRARIKTRLKPPEILTKNRFSSIVNEYYTCTVKDDLDFAVETTIWSVRGEPENISEMDERVDQVLPAHLNYDFVYTYLPWNEIEEVGLTWDQADSIGYKLETTFLKPFSGPPEGA